MGMLRGWQWFGSWVLRMCHGALAARATSTRTTFHTISECRVKAGRPSLKVGGRGRLSLVLPPSTRKYCRFLLAAVHDGSGRCRNHRFASRYRGDVLMGSLRRCHRQRSAHFSTWRTLCTERFPLRMAVATFCWYGTTAPLGCGRRLSFCGSRHFDPLHLLQRLTRGLFWNPSFKGSFFQFT